MKKNFIIGAALGVVLALSGCAAQGTTSESGGGDWGSTGMMPATSDNYIQVYVVQMPDDTSVDCVASYGMQAISCDWDRRS